MKNGITELLKGVDLEPLLANDRQLIPYFPDLNIGTVSKLSILRPYKINILFLGLFCFKKEGAGTRFFISDHVMHSRVHSLIYTVANENTETR